MAKPILTKIRIIIFILIFSLGKIIAATGQTLFGMQHATGYLLANDVASHSISLFLAGFAAICSLAVILMTRVPAIARQFHSTHTEMKIALPENLSKSRRIIFNGSILSSLACGIFSAIGAYLSTTTISEFIHLFCATRSDYLLTHSLAIFVALSTFISYYSFNYFKSRQNAARLVSMQRLPLTLSLRDKNVMKTLFVSLLSLLSIPFLSYFLTKHALISMPYIGSYLSLAVIKYIAAASAVTALITSLLTNIPAAYEYFVTKDNKMHLTPENPSWSMLRNMTYSAGMVDCSANGLSNFVSVIDVARDALELDPYGNIIYLAIGCGISSALLTAAFSVRQGFNDFASEHQRAPLKDNIPWALN
jgi:hypothetical protein